MARRTATPPPEAPKKPKAPPNHLANMERSCSKLLRQIEDQDGAPPENRQHALEFFTGLNIAIRNAPTALDPNNPPAADSALGKIHAMGVSHFAAIAILTGPPPKSEDDESSAQ